MSLRTLGLSKRQRPRPLLNFVASRPRKIHNERNIDDPPMSSDDEEDTSEHVSQSCSRTNSPLGPGQDEGTRSSYRQGDIQSTTFGSSRQVMREQRGVRRSSERLSSNTVRDATPPCQKRQRVDQTSAEGREEDNNSPTNHDMTEQPFLPRRARITRKYGDKKSKRAGLGLIVPPSIAKSPVQHSSTKNLRVPPVLPAKDNTSCTEPEKGKASGSKKSKFRPRVAQDEPPSPCRPLFKVPLELSEIESRTDNANQVKDSSDVSHNEVGDDFDQSPIIALQESKPEEPKCPWCGKVVDKKLLDNFFQGKHMKVQMQMRFCQMHKKHTAVEAWQSRGYPDIDWKTLVSRFAVHRKFLLDIIHGEKSFFRAMQAHKIATGQARTVLKEGNLNPGYYGPRGFDMMCDYLGEEYKNELKDRARSDRVIAGRGVAAFVQTVLVAELAVQLIKDDMGVSDEEAREILEDSKALGDLVHTEA
ncbi:hypothetical protein CDD81_2247 [Ophiocordyceps australis]|uniref:Restriction of telomere capping protein 4 n=1 Tax=Ophiocordyceps australis TaxID=1399860 RepID=A0A2C5Y9T0_9HYPO|nr:hypothetical protein CDD81_2247 [Ophiocordyceps australis]